MGAAVEESQRNLDNRKLMEAVNCDDSATVSRMIAAGADVNHRGTSLFTPNTPIHYAVGRFNTSIARMLIAAGALVANEYLHIAVLSGDVELVRLIAGSVADRNTIHYLQAVGGLAVTPLETAVACRRLDMLRVILASGADMNFVSPTGNTALSRAVSSNNHEIVNFLLTNGANVNLGGALTAAVVVNNVDFVRLLIDRGATINVPEDIEDNLLYLALRSSSKSMALLFVRAKPELVDTLPPIELARLGDDIPESRRILGTNAAGRRGDALLAWWQAHHRGGSSKKTRKQSKKVRRS